MRVVVTGGSGLVGRSIVRLLAREHDVLNLDPRRPADPAGSHVAASVLDPEAVARAIEGADAVVHAAAIPGPSFGTDEEIERVNVGGTRVVADAALAAGVGRFVHISSEAVLGFVFSKGRTKPDYLPIDEAHPLSPSDAYGRSKLAAETLLARRACPAMRVVSLRPPWVWVPEEYDNCRRLTTDPGAWWDGLWAYVHGDDLARVVVSALGTGLEGTCHAVYVAAPDNGTTCSSRELIDRYYSQASLRSSFEGSESLISSDACERLLELRPTMEWRHFLSTPAREKDAR